MRANDDYTAKDYVLGGSYNTTFESGAYVVEMKLVVRVERKEDFGIYKCIAKNALGNSEETIKIIRKSFFSALVPLKRRIEIFI
jgi:hypothetical protein